MAALGVLAGASAVVSYAAQYRMVLAAKAVAPVAALEAGIPDVRRWSSRHWGLRWRCMAGGRSGRGS
jgi:hypothetical protein